MFGYCESNRCPTDLWSPIRDSAVENRAFSAYAYHTSRCDEIVEQIAAGQTDSISVSDDFTDADLRYIERRLLNDYGLEAHLTLNS